MNPLAGFPHHFSLPFPSVPFVVHKANHHTPSLTSEHQRMDRNVREKEALCGRGLMLSPRHALANRSHTSHAALRAELRSSSGKITGSQKSIFPGVHSCHLPLWGAAGGSRRRQRGKAG